MIYKKKLKNDDELCDLIRDNFRKDKEHWDEVYRLCNDDMMFLWDCEKQWGEYIRNQRVNDGKPTLVFNELFVAKQAIVNRQQTNKISIKVDQGNDEASKETAEFLQNATRAVEQKSKAYVAYEHAFDCAVSGGIGFFRILTDYESPYTFDQEPRIERILNPFSVIYDRHSLRHDFQDAEHCSIFTKMPRDEHDKYADECGATKFNVINEKEFIGDDYVTIIEYFYKDYTKKTLLKIQNGDEYVEVFKEDYPNLPKELEELIVDTRKVDVPTIKWVKTNGYDILDKTEWAGDFIPIIADIGKEIYVDGKRWFFGIARHAKDAQLMLNYWVSTQTELLGLISRSPWIGVKGSFTDRKWLDANINNYAYLEYDLVVDEATGQIMPPPQRNNFDATGIQNLVQQSELASNYIKTTTGVYNASLGAPSDEKSGRAIERRNAQTEVTNYNFVNNLESAIEYAGTVLVNTIMKLWTEPSKKRVMFENGEQKIVPINQRYMDKGIEKHIDLTKGEYAVSVTAGANYATKRQEQASLTLGLMQVSPIVANNPLVSYQYARDIGADEVAQAIYKTLPPELKEEDEEGKPTLPPAVQQRMQQDAQTIEMLTQALNDEKDKSEAKAIEVQAKKEMNTENNISKEKMNAENNQIKLVIEEMKADMLDNQILFTEQMKQIQNSLALLTQKEQQEKEHELQREQMAITGQNIQQTPNAQEPSSTATAS